MAGEGDRGTTVVWTLLSARKRDRIGFDQLLALAQQLQPNVCFRVVDPAGPGQLDAMIRAVAAAPPTAAHVLLHKLSDFAKEQGGTAGELLLAVEQQLAQLPAARIRRLNSLGALRTLLDRHATVALLAARLPICFPASTAGHRPAVWKPRSACGQPDSHAMLFLPGAGGGVPAGGLVQDFVPHAGVVYKVYVLGDRVHTATRPSLTLAAFSGAAGPQPFGPEFLRQLPALSAPQTARALRRIAPLRGTIQQTSRQIAAALGLQLFGWDLIVCEHTGTPYIIDVNFFPRFEGFPDFHQHLLGLIIGR